MLEYFGLLVEDFNDRGENEEELFKNYSKKVSRSTITRCLAQHFLSLRMIQKNNRKAQEYHALGLAAYDNLEYSESIRLFTKSLCNAEYYSQDFVKALVSRLMVSYVVHDYKSCMQDKEWLLPCHLEPNLEREINLAIGHCSEKLAMQSTETIAIAGTSNDNMEGVVNEVIPANFVSDSFRGTAESSIKKGDTVFITKPYSLAPTSWDDSSVPNYCQNCFIETEILIPCKKCVEFGYCSEKCQNDAWTNFHQWECIGIRANFFKLSEFQLLALRVIFKGLELNFDHDSFFNVPSRFEIRSNWQLVESASVAVITVAYLRNKTNFFERLRIIPKFLTLTEEETTDKLGGMLIRHHLQLISHMISVQTVVGQFPEMVTYATAICPLFSKLKHSCKPNTAVYFVGGLMYVRAVKDIAENENIFVSKRNVSISNMNLRNRRKAIRKYMGFPCACSACTYFKMNELYVCSKCQQGSALPDDENKSCLCLNCDDVFKISDKYKEDTITIEKNLEMYAGTGNIEFLTKSLGIGIKIFGFKNTFLLSIYDKLIRHYIDRDHHVEFLQMVNESWKSREAIYGDISLKLGLDLCLYTEYILQFVQRMQTGAQMGQYKTLVERAVEFIEKLKSIFEIVHPPFLKKITEMEKTAEELQFLSLSAYLLEEV